MKSLFSIVCAFMVMGLAYWAYQENYRTQDATKEMKRLQREIAANRETLGILRAEWAYLNRPDRLRELVMINYEKLGLFALLPTQFGQVDQISFPPRDRMQDPTQKRLKITTPIDLASRNANGGTN